MASVEPISRACTAVVMPTVVATIEVYQIVQFYQERRRREGFTPTAPASLKADLGEHLKFCFQKTSTNGNFLANSQ